MVQADARCRHVWHHACLAQTLEYDDCCPLGCGPLFACNCQDCLSMSRLTTWAMVPRVVRSVAFDLATATNFDDIVDAVLGLVNDLEHFDRHNGPLCIQMSNDVLTAAATTIFLRRFPIDAETLGQLFKHRRAMWMSMHADPYKYTDAEVASIEHMSLVRKTINIPQLFGCPAGTYLYVTMIASDMRGRVEQHRLYVPVEGDQDIYNRMIITPALGLIVKSATPDWVSEIKVSVPAETIEISGQDGRFVIAFRRSHVDAADDELVATETELAEVKWLEAEAERAEQEREKAEDVEDSDDEHYMEDDDGDQEDDEEDEGGVDEDEEEAEELEENYIFGIPRVLGFTKGRGRWKLASKVRERFKEP